MSNYELIHPLEVGDRSSETPLQVGEKLYDIYNLPV